MAKNYPGGKTKTPDKNKSKYNPNHKPENLSLEEWQKALRIQVAKKENLHIDHAKNVDEGYFTVFNPKNGKSYSVVYRGGASSWNYCSCPDFRTNRLGTCKHIEAVAMAKNGRYSRRTYCLPNRSTVYLDYKGNRTVRLRAGGGEISRGGGLWLC